MKKLLTVTCLAGLLSIPSVVFADEVVPEEAMSDEAMAEEAMPVEPEISPEMQGHIGDSHSGAVWYGSLRIGVKSVSGGDSSVSNISSRFGVMGSSEISEGLNAVYHYSQAIDGGNATILDGDYHSYVGLEGGFGSLTIGRVTSAGYGTVGVITNKTYSQGPGAFGIPSRVGNAIHYGLDVSGVKLQADVIMDSRPNDIDEVIFGISVPVGDIGKVAFAHVNRKAYSETIPLTTQSQKGIAIPDQSGAGTSITAFDVPNVSYTNVLDFQLPFDYTKVSFSDQKYTYKIPKSSDGKTPKQVFNVLELSVYEPVTVADDGKVTPILKPQTLTTVRQLNQYKLVGEKYYHKDCTKGTGKTGDPYIRDKEVTCKNSSIVYYYNKNENTVGATEVDNLAVWSNDPKLHVSGNYTTTSTVATSSTIDETTELPTTIDVSTTQDMSTVEHAKYSSNHIAAEATLGAVKGYLGYSEQDTGGVKTDATQFGISGGLGESGVSYIIEVNKEEVNTNWGIGVYKSLGGGASVNFEHGNDKNVSTSVAFIVIDF